MVALSRAERRLWSWHQGCPPPAGIPYLIDRHAATAPYAPAVRCGADTLTYQDLTRRADRIAHWLTGQGVRPEHRIGVMLPRSTDLVAALLAILKAGAAYVPVDPDYPG